MGPKFRFLVQKSDFCHKTPILVNGPFVALGNTIRFPPWEPFFDIPFRSYSHFRKKRNRLTRPKVFPLPTVITKYAIFTVLQCMLEKVAIYGTILGRSRTKPDKNGCHCIHDPNLCSCLETALLSPFSIWVPQECEFQLRILIENSLTSSAL